MPIHETSTVVNLVDHWMVVVLVLGVTENGFPSGNSPLDLADDRDDLAENGRQALVAA